MKISRKNAIAGLAISLLSTLGASTAIAQEVLISPVPVPVRRGAPLEYQNGILEKFYDSYFENDRDFFKNRTFPRQVDWLIGVGGFPEIEITRDGKEVNDTYRRILARQMASGPIIRVFDLPTPFCQSLRTIPDSPSCLIDGCSRAGCPVTAQPIAPPGTVPPFVDRVPPEPPVPQQVPALW